MHVYSILSIAPAGPPTSVTARSTSARSISISWGPPSRDQQNGILRHYLVTLVSDAGVQVTRNVSSIQQLISISGLRPYTVYDCTVRAETVALGPASAAVRVNTPQDGENKGYASIAVNKYCMPK